MPQDLTVLFDYEFNRIWTYAMRQCTALSETQEEYLKGELTAYLHNKPPFCLPSTTSPATHRHVYLIQRGKARIFKIGISRSPHQRLHQLQNGNIERLILVATWKVSNAHAIEKQLHMMFASCRKSGEWFALSVDQEAELMIYMKQYEDLANE